MDQTRATGAAIAKAIAVRHGQSRPGVMMITTVKAAMNTNGKWSFFPRKFIAACLLLC